MFLEFEKVLIFDWFPFKLIFYFQNLSVASTNSLQTARLDTTQPFSEELVRLPGSDAQDVEKKMGQLVGALYAVH